MKKTLVLAVGVTMLLGSCGTYAGAGAYTGAQFGSILGSAIGGISNGPRGADVGTIIGMASGAAIGAAIGDAADRRAKEEMYEHRERVKERRAANERMSSNERSRQYEDNYDSGFDATNSGDDRIYDFNGSDYTGNYSAQQPTEAMPMESSVDELATKLEYAPHIEICNARFVDDNQDGVISRGEVSKVIFEVFNTGQHPVYDIQPTVIDVTENKHLYVSPSLHVESIAPGKGIRYTAIVKADNRIKQGTVKICCSVLQGDRAISKVSEFNIEVRK